MEKKYSEKHYGAIVMDSIYHAATEGDERSRTNPGHGYPASPSWDEPVTKYEYLGTKEAMETWVLRQEKLGKSYGKKPYQIVLVEPLMIETVVSVKYPS